MEKIEIVVAIVIIFLVIHIIRMFRIYILLIEEKMPLKKFVNLYLKTTFINNIIPFKLGEFYKMICYGKKLKSFSAGLSLIWLDRFFDSLILLILTSIATKWEVMINVILIAFILFSILAYTSFESTYKYFNTLVLEKGVSKRSKVYLEVIEETKKVHKRAKNMLSFRGTTLIMLSVIIWAFEYLLAYLTLNLLFNREFGLTVFTNYIDGAFTPFHSNYTDIFYFNISIMAVLFTGIWIGMKFTNKGAKNEK